MELWRRFLRLFGLSNEARVQITAPGIEVLLTGDPDEVRALLEVVRDELERRRAPRPPRRKAPISESQFVRPTELDEMDSPYALPEAIVRPVEADEQTTAECAPVAEVGTLPSITEDEPSDGPMSTQDIEDDEPDPEPTALLPHPAAGATPKAPLDERHTPLGEVRPKNPFASSSLRPTLVEPTHQDDG